MERGYSWVGESSEVVQIDVAFMAPPQPTHEIFLAGVVSLNFFLTVLVEA